MIFFSIGGVVSGRLALKIQHKAIVRLSSILILIGFISISIFLDPAEGTRSLYILYVFYGIFGGFGVGLSYNAIVSAITRWYPGRTGMASGLLLFGFGMGGLVLGSVINALTGITGIASIFMILGVVMAVILLALSFLIGIPKADEPESESSSEKIEASISAIRDYPLSKAIRTSSFWVLFLWSIAMATGGLLVINSAANIAVYFGAFAVLGLIVSVFNGIGRLTLGLVFDRSGRSNAMLINSLLMLSGGIVLVLGAVSGHILLVFIGLPLIGMSYGGAPTLTSAATMSFFGPKNFSLNYGVAVTAVVPAAIIGPLVSSRLQEISGGSYLTTFVMLIIIGAATVIISLILSAIRKSV